MDHAASDPILRGELSRLWRRVRPLKPANYQGFLVVIGYSQLTAFRVPEVLADVCLTQLVLVIGMFHSI